MQLKTIRVIPGEGIPGDVKSHASGGRDLWSDPLPFVPTDRVDAVWGLLKEVLDPEIPISLVDLGLIYGVDVEDEVVTVTITYTATACPCMAFIREDITDRLTRESWIDTVEIEEVWEPVWTSSRISPEGRDRLRELGVGV